MTALPHLLLAALSFAALLRLASLRVKHGPREPIASPFFHEPMNAQGCSYEPGDPREVCWSILHDEPRNMR